MTTDTFRASVQYGDLKGTAAADRADRATAEAWLESLGLKQPDELLVGITLFAGENHGKHKDPVSVNFLLAKPGDFDTVKQMIDSTQGPIDLRSVRKEMTVAEFLGLFKRFSIYISNSSLLEGRGIRYQDS